MVTEEMIQSACAAGYGVDTDKDSNLHKVMRRALEAALPIAVWGWKEIQSAPKDGTQCWLSVWANGKEGGERYVVRGYFGEGQWRAADDDEPLHQPTHFIVIRVPTAPH